MPSHFKPFEHLVPVDADLVVQRPEVQVRSKQTFEGTSQSASTLHALHASVGSWTGPVGSTHESIVQAFPSSTGGAWPATQTPFPLQRSAPLQVMPSLQLVPCATKPTEQTPPPGPRVHDEVKHGPLGQSAALEQAMHSGIEVCVMLPVSGSHESTVHTFPSSTLIAGCVMFPEAGSHKSCVHAFLSSVGTVGGTG